MWHKRSLTNSIQMLRRVYGIHPKSNSFLGYRYEQKCFLFHIPLEWKPDRGLDHAVEKEKNLRALVALKDIVKKKPGASLPIHAVSQKSRELGITTGVRKLIRSYPSIFEQYVDEKDKLTWFRLTKEALYLDEEEVRIHQEQESEAAMRLCKFLMMTREKRIHLSLIDKLKWHMGLPNDYVERLVPIYPDYFSVINMPDNKPGLDLVCWNDELAVSELQRRAVSNGGHKKGMPLAFPMSYSKRYDVKQGYVKWAEGWQRLPYISPYEDASHLDPCSDLLEKRVVGVMHEVLSLMIEKSAVKRYLVDLKEYLGLPQRFEKCFERHPGIFYLCSKNGIVTVMLREAYKRDELVEAHPLVKLRGKFAHVMKKGVKDRKKGDDKNHVVQEGDADHEGSGKSEESMEESSDNNTCDEEEFSDDEDESSEDDQKEETSEKNITTHKQQGGSFHLPGRNKAPLKLSERGSSRLKASNRQPSSSKAPLKLSERGSSRLKVSNRQPSSSKAPLKLSERGSSRLKPSNRQPSSSRTSRWSDNNRQTSGREGRRDTSGRQAGKLQASQNGDNKSKRYGHPSRSETYERPGNKFTTSKSQESKSKSTGKRESNFEASQHRQTKISRKDSSTTRITKFTQ